MLVYLVDCVKRGYEYGAPWAKARVSSNVASWQDCRRNCNSRHNNRDPGAQGPSSAGCGAWTYYSTSKKCNMFISAADQLKLTKVSGVISGERVCRGKKIYLTLFPETKVIHPLI